MFIDTSKEGWCRDGVRIHGPAIGKRSPARASRLLAAAAILWTCGCGDGGGVSAADVQQAAKERIQQELGLTAEAALFTNVFVGREWEGEPVVCGTVGGRRADGSVVAPRRFIVGTNQSRFLSFEPARATTHVTQPDMFAEWAELCAGAEGEPEAEPLAPTDIEER
jgi:hypothetical protein